MVVDIYGKPLKRYSMLLGNTRKHNDFGIFLEPYPVMVDDKNGKWLKHDDCQDTIDESLGRIFALEKEVEQWQEIARKLNRKVKEYELPKPLTREELIEAMGSISGRHDVWEGSNHDR